MPLVDVREQTEVLESGRVLRIRLLGAGGPLSWREVLQGWQSDAFSRFFNDLLAAAPYQAYFWETPPLTSAALALPFEFVLADSPSLAQVSPDPAAFERHFAAAASEAVTVFPNLGGDATLVVPCPRAAPAVYPHLAAFARGAPAAQQQALWARLAAEVLARLTPRPLWISTSGLGVYWLHVRLDQRPKYYSWKPYTVFDPGAVLGGSG